MLKIRRPLGRLIFNMGIAIPGKTVFLIETAPRKWKAVFLYFMGLYNFTGRHAYNSTYKDEYIEIYFLNMCILQIHRYPSPEHHSIAPILEMNWKLLVTKTHGCTTIVYWLWPNDALWRHGPHSILITWTKCCFIISKVVSHSPKSNSNGNVHESDNYVAFESCTFYWHLRCRDRVITKLRRPSIMSYVDLLIFSIIIHTFATDILSDLSLRKRTKTYCNIQDENWKRLNCFYLCSAALCVVSS